jgi:argininosuccinate synthase
MLTIYSNSLTDGTVRLKLRSGATDNSSSAYNYAAYNKTRTNVNDAFVGADVSGGFILFQVDNGGNADTVSYTGIVIDLFDNFATRWTKIVNSGHYLNASTIPAMVTGAGFHAVATSYDGINIISDGGTLTGQLSVYGYNK